MSGLIKFFGAILFTIALIVIINFIGDKVITTKDLPKNAVTISEKIEVAKTKIKAPSPKTETSKNIKEPAQESITTLLASANIKKGAKLSKKCAACHSFDNGGKNKMGPNLWNVVGSKKATKEGYKYSKALNLLGGKWDYNSLSEFLLKPRNYAPGTKMGFAGIKKIEDRAALIAWLRNQADTPYPLPNE